MSRQILHDPDSYINPLEFNPERFLGEDPEPDPRETAFGYGRRICECFSLLSCHFMLRFVNLTRKSDGYVDSDKIPRLSLPTTETTDTSVSPWSSLPRSRITPCAVNVMARLCHVTGGVEHRKTC